MIIKFMEQKRVIIATLISLSIGSAAYSDVSIQVGSTPNQTMRYGMDYERLWYWTNTLSADEKDLVAQWSVADNDIDFIRVAINSGYELTEGEYNLSAYTNKIIPMMQDMQDANPDIKFFASPRPLDEAMDDVAWQPYPQWITGSTGSDSDFSFDWEKCAEYLVRYIELMDSYGFEISYLDLTNEWNYVTPTHVRDIAEYLEADLASKSLTMPQIIAPSTWSYAQGSSWLDDVNTTRRRDAIDIAASHNTNSSGSAQGFVETAQEILGTTKEIWNTELHDWKSTSGYDEVLTFSYVMEAVNAGISGISGWLAIGTTNQGHSYILNPSGTPSRNVKYFIFNKLTNTSHRGQALDIETPDELSHTMAFIKDNLITVWAINPNDEPVDVLINLTDYTATNQPVTMTYWNTESDIEGVVSDYVTTSATSISGTVPAGSLSLFEITIDDEDVVNDESAQSFTPDPEKTYYLDVPEHNLRLAATGESEDPYTTSTDVTGDDVEWQFIDKGNGYWHIQRAAGGTAPRLRTDGTLYADMQPTSNSGTYTYYEFTEGASDDTHFLTLPDGPEDYQRLQITNAGEVRFLTTAAVGSWESWEISEVNEDTVVHMIKRNADSYAIDGNYGGANEQDVYLWTENENNANQQWLELDRGGNYYSYQKADTDYCLDGGNGGSDRQNVYLWECDEDNQNQHWLKVDQGNGYYSLVKRNASGYAIDGNNSGEDGQSIYLWSVDEDNMNQHWLFNEL